VPQNIAQCWKQPNPEAVPLSVSSLIQRQANERLQDQGKPAPSPQIIPPAPKVPQIKAATKPRTHAHKGNKATSTKQAPVQDQRYFVQVGVYSSQSNIKTVQKQLTNIGMKMVLEPMNGDLSGSRRLLVGPYATKEAASKALKRLSILGMGGLVVTRTP
jgi:DedD protein